MSSSADIFRILNIVSDEIINFVGYHINIEKKEEGMDCLKQLMRIYHLTGKLNIYEEMNNTLRIKETKSSIKVQLTILAMRFPLVNQTILQSVEKIKIPS